jgi:YVTN family beta-propeller protein
VIDVASDEVTKTIGLGDYPYGVAFNPAADEAYVTDGNDSVFVIDTIDDSLVATIPVGSTPEGIAVTPDGNKAYAADWNEKNVSVIDLSQRRVIATVGVGFGPVGVAVSPDGKKVYVANGGYLDADNTVSVIDTDSDTLMYSIPVGSGPHGIAVTPDGKQVCVVSDETLSIIDVATDKIVGTVDNVGPSPIAFGQFMIPPKLVIAPVPVLPFANFTSNVTEGYAPLDVQFTNLSTNETHLEWNFGDSSGNTSVANPEHIFTSTGQFNVVLTANNTNGSSSKNVTINVTAKPLTPVAGFTEDVKSGVAPIKVNFTDKSQYATTVNWDFNGDGIIDKSSTPGNQTYTYTTPGTYVVNQTAINVNGTNSTTDTISVTKAIIPVKANFTFSANYLAVQFTDTSTGTPNNWTWDYGDNSGSNAKSPSYTYSNAGTYNVKLTVKNADGITDSITKSVTVTAPPLPSALKINDFKADVASGHEPLTVHFSSDVSGSPTMWTWKFEKSGTQSFKVGTATHTFMQDGIYDVALTVKDAKGHNDTMTKKAFITVVKVNPPKANFTANVTSGKAPLNVQFNDTSKNNPTIWLWSFGDGHISIKKNPVNKYEKAGKYTVTLVPKF